MSQRFPHRFTPETRVAPWQRLRVEGLSFGQALWNSVSYFRKSIYKKKSAPPEELRYFAAQRKLFEHLQRHSPSPGGARVALLGDIMWLRDGWDSFLDRPVLDHLNAHDVVIGNLESVITPRFKVPSLLPDYLTYNSHPGLVSSFRRPDGRSTFTSLSLSNNHALDRGELGARDTQDLLGDLAIAHSGIVFRKDDCPYTVFESNGIRFGFHAAAWGLNSFVPPHPNVHMHALPAGVFSGGSSVDLPAVRRVLADMSADGCDIRIVALHWGYEFEYYPDPAVMRVGHEVVRAGADIVLGTHPHVQQPCETLFVNGYESRLPDSVRSLGQEATLAAEGPPRKALIAYSMGNFASTMFTFACKVGWVLSLNAFRDSATGRADWHPAGSTFVVNVPRFGRDRTRRLLLLEDYRRQRDCNGGIPAKEKAHFSFLHRHLFGNEEGSSTPDEYNHDRLNGPHLSHHSV
ncbi:MAG TPA: CapA family protein [Gemmata sp.]|nr:CapA family protein [Gemmata sp.]